ncbi:Phage capsid scaffolding protein (GPO) serine peptidase [Raoultella terrigena]|nr:Phage capsid scaffolding protein (GPO) serine peptidase [Raoultella terrigena]
MAGTTKPRKKFRVAVSGNTVDGREIQPQHLRDAAANYSQEVYGARVNIEHYLSPYPGSDFWRDGRCGSTQHRGYYRRAAGRSHGAVCGN